MRFKWLYAVVIVVLSIAAYFVVYPDDLDALLPFAQVLDLTQRVSPWLYLLLAVTLVCRSIERVWGRGPRPGI